MTVLNININGSLVLDQTEDQQLSPDGTDTEIGDDDASNVITNDLFGLSSEFITFLTGLSGDINALDTDDSAFADLVEASVSGTYGAESDPIVTVDQDGSTVNSLYFSDGDGNLLDGDQVYVGTDPMQTIYGDNVYLWSYGDNYVVATTSNDPNNKGDIVAAFYLDTDGDPTTANIEMVTFIPLDHPDDTDPDDSIDFSDILNITATGSLEFTFDNLDSGNFLHVTVGTEAAGLLVTGRNLVIEPDGDRDSNDSDSVNTSQGGTNATIGINNQMMQPAKKEGDPDNTAVFNFVVGQAPGTYTNIGTLDYDDFLDVRDGYIFISQVQGAGKDPVFTMRLETYSAGGTGTDPEDGVGYIDNDIGGPGDSDLGTDPGDDALADDDPVDLYMVQVLDENGTVVERKYADGTNDINDADIDITILDNSAEITGFNDQYTVQWFVDDPTTVGVETYNRFHITALEGKFDVGKVGTSEGVIDTVPVGDNLIVDDDGPTAHITDTGVTVTHDETAGVQDGTELVDTTPGADDDDQPNAGAPPVFAALGSFIGWALSPTAVVSTTGTDWGTDGPATAPDDAVWSLDVSGPNADSTFDSLDGHDILLNVETIDVGGNPVDVVVGRIDANDDGSVSGSDDVGIAILIGQGGSLSVAQYVPIAHTPDTGPDQSATMIDSALLAVLTVQDADGDEHSVSEAIGDKVIIEDDGPAGGDLATETLEEDDLATALSTGYNEDPSVGKYTATINLQDGISNTGVDFPVSFALSGTDPNSVLDELFSKGDSLHYVTTLDDATESGADVVRAYADYGTLDVRLVFQFEVLDNGDGTGTATLTIFDQLDHGEGLVPDSENFELLSTGGSLVDEIDFTDLLELRDADGDLVSLSDGFLTYEVQDDRPDIGPIANSVLDFASGATVTKTLNGTIGADENDASNETADGTKTYTFASYTNDTTAVPNLQAALIEDDTRVVYFTDGEGGSAGVFDDGIDTLYYDVVLNQGTGDYTFTVYQDPPPAYLEFDFEDLPSGQNLHGTIAIDKLDLGAGGLLLFPKDADLDSDGEMTNVSPTTNTSKGGGPVTIGNSNQMFDPGEGHYFVYVDDPDAAATAGVGLDQNNADDADTVGFDGTIEVSEAEVEIVQVQGGSLAEMKISAFDLTLAGAVGTGDTIDPRDFVTNPESFDSGVDILSVRVYDGLGNLLEEEAVGDGGTPTTDDGIVDIVFNGDGTVNVSGVDDDYVVQWETNGVHDMALIEGVAGKYDIGGFNLAEAQPTPDQSFDYTVDITDFDDDTSTDGFSVGLDGTGIYDDDAVVGV